MKHALPSLDALKVFESAARHLSFSRAAQELCLTKGAVSYQIRKLEEALDCALFRRAVRQVYLTEAGQQLLKTTQPLFAELEQTLARLGNGDSGTEVLIGITTYVALRWLSPRLASFSDRNPGIPILMQHTVNDDDFRLQDVDFAIFWCAMQGQSGRSRLVEMPMSLYPVCSPAMLERVGNPPRAGKWLPADLASPPLADTPLLCEARNLDLWASWYGEQDRPLSNPRRVIADANVRTQAAVDGLGWTMADALMQQELDHGLLVAPFEHRLDGYGYVIQAAPARFASQDALKLRNWLLEHV
jgi:LysR family glycine cleavage system transcriptional activator